MELGVGGNGEGGVGEEGREGRNWIGWLGRDPLDYEQGADLVWSYVQTEFWMKSGV